ncbi:hypothetical protein ABH935_009284 [Catenulispora sp. GAS73]|uniref:hypothetical protein n=1 Tax=Catenulispora sp. GAS73 TaxID=3156269 RepID=UPI003516218D
MTVLAQRGNTLVWSSATYRMPARVFGGAVINHPAARRWRATDNAPASKSRSNRITR